MIQHYCCPWCHASLVMYISYICQGLYWWIYASSSGFCCHFATSLFTFFNLVGDDIIAIKISQYLWLRGRWIQSFFPTWLLRIKFLKHKVDAALLWRIILPTKSSTKIWKGTAATLTEQSTNINSQQPVRSFCDYCWQWRFFCCFFFFIVNPITSL